MACPRARIPILPASSRAPSRLRISTNQKGRKGPVGSPSCDGPAGFFAFRLPLTPPHDPPSARRRPARRSDPISPVTLRGPRA
jgi:hypothetical protein